MPGFCDFTEYGSLIDAKLHFNMKKNLGDFSDAYFWWIVGSTLDRDLHVKRPETTCIRALTCKSLSNVDPTIHPIYASENSPKFFFILKCDSTSIKDPYSVKTKNPGITIPLLKPLLIKCT